MFLSVISPVYKADGIIKELTELISGECFSLNIDFEIILVNDASPDNSWEIIRNIALSNKNVRGINFSKNFGQHAAINAGLALAKGEYVIVMDCDMQHHPKYIPQLINKIKEGYDIVFTITDKRSHSFFKNFLSAVYHKIYNYLTELDSNYNYTAYTIISSKVLAEYSVLKDYHSHYIPKLRWIGFNQAVLKIDHFGRGNGKSSYTVKKLFIEAINGITSHSTKLLRLNVAFGVILSFISFLGMVYIIIGYFMHGFLAGWASITTLVLFSLGVLLTSIGITGIYIGQVFEQVKRRPQYIIKDTINFK